jgi:hypothetical protein
MPSYNDVHTKIWEDPKFRAYKPNAKLIFLNVWTNSNANLCCIYELDRELSVFQTGLTKEEYNAAFQEIQDSGAIEYDPEHRLVWVVNRFKYRPKSPAVIVGAITELNFIYNHIFVQKFIDRYMVFLLPFIDRLHTVYRPSLNKQTDKQTDKQTNKDLSTYLSTENIKTLKSVFKDTPTVKSHLLSLGFPEFEVDKALLAK